MAHSENIISKIKLPGSETIYEIHDSHAIHDLSDWNAAEGESGYIKNKPFYEEKVVLLPPTQFERSSENMLNGYGASIPGHIDIIEGKSYTVNWNGVEYTTEGVSVTIPAEGTFVILGNPALFLGTDNGLPFLIASLAEAGTIYAVPTDDSLIYTVGIITHEVKELPERYLPEHLQWEKETKDIILAAGEFTSSYDSTYGAFWIGINFYEEQPEAPKNFTIVFDGTTYNISQITTISNLGTVFGNLYFLNAIVGTNFENTGEPFLGSVGPIGFDLYLMETEATQHKVKFTIPGKVTIPEQYLPEHLHFGEDTNAQLLPLTPFEYDDSFGVYAVPGHIDFVEGKTYIVNWNGVDYTTVGVPAQFQGTDFIAIGNTVALGGEDNGLPFAAGCLMGAIAAIPLDGSTNVNVGIKGYALKTIPEKYLPSSLESMIVETVPVEGTTFGATDCELMILTPNVTNSDIIQAVKDGIEVRLKCYYLGEIGYFDLAPNYIGRFALASPVVGVVFSAIWHPPAAATEYSNMANVFVIVEENSIKFKLMYSVGQNIIGKEFTIDGTKFTAGRGAEIFNTSNIAIGDYSHAEGYQTTARGNYSHAEGAGTKAIGEHSHVQGKWNIEDTENKYAHIVGNGEQFDKSNAHTLDWDGNAWFAGDVRIGGTSYTDASVLLTATSELITVEDIDEICGTSIQVANLSEVEF